MRARGGLWLEWTAATIAGYVLAGLAALWLHGHRFDLALSLVLPALTQAFVLWRRIHEDTIWVLGTAAGAALLLVFEPLLPRQPLLVVGAGGLLVGVLQSLVLRRHSRDSFLWIGAVILASVVASLAGQLAQGYLHGGLRPIQPLLIAPISGLAYGLVTGYALELVLKAGRARPSSSKGKRAPRPPRKQPAGGRGPGGRRRRR